MLKTMNVVKSAQKNGDVARKGVVSLPFLARLQQVKYKTACHIVLDACFCWIRVILRRWLLTSDVFPNANKKLRIHERTYTPCGGRVFRYVNWCQKRFIYCTYLHRWCTGAPDTCEIHATLNARKCKYTSASTPVRRCHTVFAMQTIATVPFCNLSSAQKNRQNPVHEACEAALSHRHHPIIRFDAGPIQLVYGSHSHLAADLILHQIPIPSQLKASFLIVLTFGSIQPSTTSPSSPKRARLWGVLHCIGWCLAGRIFTFKFILQLEQSSVFSAWQPTYQKVAYPVSLWALLINSQPLSACARLWCSTYPLSFVLCSCQAVLHV